MAEASRYDFTWKDITILLIREQGITEGHWAISLPFNWQAGSSATSGIEPVPSIAMHFPRLSLERVEIPNPMSIDASKIASKPSEWPDQLPNIM